MRLPPRIPVIAILALAPSALAAQGAGHAGLITGVEYRSLSYGTGSSVSSVNEIAVPLGISMPLGSRVNFDVGTYFVRAERKAIDSTSTISGLTDLVLRSAFQIKPDAAIFTLAVNVPTGKHQLNNQQNLLAGNVATDLIPFPVSNFGSGFSVTSGLALAKPIGPWAMGLAGSFRYSGSYQPFTAPNDTSMLKPGGEVRFRLGADRIVGQGRMSLGFTYSTFSNDEYAGVQHSPGTRIIPQASWNFPVGRNSLALYAWDVYRSADSSAVSAKVNANTVSGGALFAVPMGRNSLRPQIEFRQSSGDVNTKGTLIGFGLRYAIVGARMTLTPGLRYDIASGVGSSNVSLTGFNASLTINSSL
ncbi:MAG TPA: hypothetical protein VGI92_13395 [Gemmatimonadales bacterium]|jgi:hypothetical protein